MDRREERESDAELLVSLLPHSAEFDKGRKQVFIESSDFALKVKLCRLVLKQWLER